MPAARPFAAFAERNYRLFYVGNLVSLTGTWAEGLAVVWLAYRITGHDEAWLGYVAAAPAIPALLLSIPAGSLVDRVRARTVLYATQSGMMLASILLALHVVSGGLRPWHLVAYALLSRGFFAVDAPARQTFVARLVGKERVANAVALNATAFNLARFLGAGMFGVIMAAGLAETGCILFNACSYAVVLTTLLLLRDVRDGAEPRSPPHPLEGLRYALRTPHTRAAIGLVIVLALFGYQLTHLLPVYAKKVFLADERGLEILAGALGVGSLLGGITLSATSHRIRRGRLVTRNIFLTPLLLCAFALSPGLEVATGVIVAIGFFSVRTHASLNAILQTTVPEEIRGRLLALFTLSILTAFPLGGLLAGFLSKWMGAPATTLLDAGVVLVAAIVVTVTHPELRRS